MTRLQAQRKSVSTQSLWLLGTLIVVCAVALCAAGGASGAGAGSPASQVNLTATAAAESCNEIWSTNFPHNDPKTQPVCWGASCSNAPTYNVTIGGEDYTSVPAGNDGVRMRDFRDSLLPVEGQWPNGRPGGNNFQDIWYTSAAGGYNTYYRGGDNNGIYQGGLSQIDGAPYGPGHPNGSCMSYNLPGFSLTTDFTYQAKMRRVEVDPGPNHLNGTNQGGGRVDVGGIATNGHRAYFEVGFGGYGPWLGGNQGSSATAGFVDHDAQSLIWGTYLAGTWPFETGWHDLAEYYTNGYIQASYDSAISYPPFHLSAAVTALDHISICTSAWRDHVTIIDQYREAQLDWVKDAQVTSWDITLPAGYTRFGVFDASFDRAASGTVEYYLIDSSGMRAISAPIDLRTLSPEPTGAIKLRAVMHRNSIADTTPRLISWSVQGCRPITPTPTTTATATRTPTPTPTRPPTNTPTPPAYIQSGIFKPYIHLRVDERLNPPAAPNNQTDWTEDQPEYYPMQAWAGIVPSVYQPQPTKLCYWNGASWTCVPGQVNPTGYSLRAVERDGKNYLDTGGGQPISKVYARAHKYLKWALWDYRYDEPGEYTYLIWLAPNGVTPTCSPGYRCGLVINHTPGVDKIVYSVYGTIHFDAIPGVGGPYDLSFNDTYKVPISIVAARAEP